MWAIVAIVIVGFSAWGFAEYSNVKMNNESAENEIISLRHPVSEVVENKIYSVDELAKSNLIEGTEVLVKGRYGIELINAGPDYEGPGGGSYLFGQTEKIHISFNGLPNTETNQVITVKGKVKYCGGKKIVKYLCALTDVRVLTGSSISSAKESGQINQVSIADILSNSDQYLDKKVQLEEKFCGWGQTTGSAGPLFTRSDWCICQNPQKKAEQSLTVTGAALPDGVSPSESESIGEILSITGVVKKTSNNIPYIEAEKIVKE